MQIIGNIYGFVTQLMPFAFSIILLVFFVISIILNHHWNKYGINNLRIQKVKKIYFGGSTILILLMLITLIILFL